MCRIRTNEQKQQEAGLVQGAGGLLKLEPLERIHGGLPCEVFTLRVDQHLFVTMVTGYFLLGTVLD